jgi:hypothetical protein
MEGLGNRLSALHFLMSSIFVFPIAVLALKLLQLSIVLLAAIEIKIFLEAQVDIII